VGRRRVAATDRITGACGGIDTRIVGSGAQVGGASAALARLCGPLGEPSLPRRVDRCSHWH
jgi:hypothetical protein